MAAWAGQFTDFMIKKVLPIVDVFLFFMAVFSALVNLPLWAVVGPWSDNSLHKVLSLFISPPPSVTINYGWLIVNIPRILRFSSIALILVCCWRIVSRGKFWLSMIPFMSLLMISWASQYWSITPAITRERLLYFSAVAFAALYFGLQFSLKKILRLFEAFSVLVVLGTLFAVMRQPQYAIQSDIGNYGAWRGFFWWKSYLGEITGLAMVVFLYRWADYRKNHWLVNLYAFLFYILSFFILIKSESVTQLFALLTAHLVLLVLVSFSKWGDKLTTRWRWLLGGILILTFILAWLGRGQLFSLFGRNASLTGRLPVWEALIPYVKQRPLLGYGFGEAFWKYEIDQQAVFQQAISKAAGWNVPFAHNGFIEMILSTGFLGLLFLVAFLVQVIIASVCYYLHKRTIPSAIFLSWIAYILIANLADNMLGSYENFTVLLLVIAFAVTLRDRLEMDANLKVHLENAV